jgi:hypothetical protein
MEQLRQLAVVGDYLGFHEVLRARAVELGLTREILDHRAGWPSGYAGKLLGDPLAPRSPKTGRQSFRGLGPVSLGLMLEVLGLKLAVLEDPEATARAVASAPQKKCKPGGHLNLVVPITPAVDPAAAELGRRGGQATAKALSPSERAEFARRAAQARWGRPRKKEAGR